MKLTDRQEALFEFVKEQHGDQLRKYNDIPYWHHLLSVAKLTRHYLDEGTEIALCHDPLEDTTCTDERLFKELVRVDYSQSEAGVITEGVIELTDVFIKENYPELNRRERKKREAERLGNISPLSQSVKYADLIDNTSSIVSDDPQFARVYVREGIQILDHMREGNVHLLMECSFTIKKAMKELGIDVKDRSANR